MSQMGQTGSRGPNAACLLYPNEQTSLRRGVRSRMSHSRQFAPQQVAPLVDDFVGAGEEHGTRRGRVFRLFIDSNLDILKTTGYRRSACQRSANIAFNGLPDQIRRPAELIPSARERHARPSTAKGMVAAPFIGACFEMDCRRLVFGGLHHSRMGELHSRSQGLADYAVGSGSWSGFRADDPWRTSERIDPVCGN